MPPHPTVDALPVHDAVRAGDLAALRSAIAAGAALDQRDASGCTALLAAVRAGRADHVEALLDAGARPDAHDARLATRRWTRLGANAAPSPRGPGSPLHEAAAVRDGGSVVRVLLGRGFDREACDPHGSTPLMIAAFTAGDTPGLDDPLDALLAAGASVTAQDRAGHTALDAATRAHVVERLLAAGADPSGGAPPAVTASYHEEPLVVRWAMLGDAKVVGLLLDAGADLGRAPGALVWAAHYGHAGVVDRLLAAGASPDERARDVPALAAAAAFARREIVDHLLAAGAREVSVALFSAAGHALLIGDVDLRERLDDRLAVARALLAAGADPSAPEPRHVDATALHVAADGGAPAIAALLLEAGADVHARDSLGRTPLHVAAENGCAAVAKLLLAAGADPKATNASGATAYQIARHSSTPPALRERRPDRGEQTAVMALLREAGGGPPEPPPAPRPAGFGPGDRVQHAKFGAGTVAAVEGSGDDAKLTIEFAGSGRKTLMARFVKRADG